MTVRLYLCLPSVLHIPPGLLGAVRSDINRLLSSVKGILAFVYEFITRDPTLAMYDLGLVDEKGLEDPAKWIKHPDVELDHDVEDFR